MMRSKTKNPISGCASGERPETTGRTASPGSQAKLRMAAVTPKINVSKPKKGWLSAYPRSNPRNSLVSLSVTICRSFAYRGSP